jgi:cyclomaltodextrinase
MLDTFVPQTFIGNHDVTRIASRLSDPRHLPHALAVLLTCGGTPSVYAGDEQAFLGIKEARAGGDDAIRPAFPANPAQLAPYGWPTYRLHQELIGLRRRHPWLTHARSRMIALHNTDLIYEASHGDNRLWVALNLADTPVTRALPAGVDGLAGDVVVRRNGASTEITLPAHGWGILGMASDGGAGG